MLSALVAGYAGPVLVSIEAVRAVAAEAAVIGARWSDHRVIASGLGAAAAHALLPRLAFGAWLSSRRTPVGHPDRLLISSQRQCGAAQKSCHERRLHGDSFH